MASVPWPLSSTNRPRGVKRRTQIVIPLYTKPRDYVPGSGPALQPLRLIPTRDSSAHILDRILLPSPGLAKDGRPLPKRMTYLVGWSDLPAARLFVPAMQILEYVSPRALEDWEARMEDEIDEDKAKIAREAAQPAAYAPKKRGRPPKNSQIETAVVAEPEPKDKGAIWPSKGVMSITTPTKPQLVDFCPDSEDEEGSPSRQIEREAMGRAMELGRAENLNEVGVGKHAPRSQDAMETDSSMNYTSAAASERDSPRRRVVTGPPSFALTSTSPRFAAGTTKARASASPKPNRNSQVNWKNSTSSGFTPVSRSSASIPGPTGSAQGVSKPISPAQPSRGATPSTKGHHKPPAKRPRAKAQKPVAKEPLQPVNDHNDDDNQDAGDKETAWEVKGIEDSELYEVEGRGLVRYFKVRWEGNWPADQNPSWEPEDNLPPNLVRNYFKRPKKRPRYHPPQKKTKETTLPWASTSGATQFKSVSEAFAGDTEGVETATGNDHMDLLEDSREVMDEEQDELLVVDEQEKPPARFSWESVNGRNGRHLGAVPM